MTQFHNPEDCAPDPPQNIDREFVIELMEETRRLADSYGYELLPAMVHCERKKDAQGKPTAEMLQWWEFESCYFVGENSAEVNLNVAVERNTVTFKYIKETLTWRSGFMIVIYPWSGVQWATTATRSVANMKARPVLPGELGRLTSADDVRNYILAHERLHGEPIARPP